MNLKRTQKLVIFLVFASILASFPSKAETKNNDISESSKSETKELDPRQLFTLDPAGIRVILQHTKFAAILFHNQEYPSSIDEILKQAALDIAGKRLKRGLSTLLFGTVDIHGASEIAQEIGVAVPQQNNYVFALFVNQQLIVYHGSMTKEAIIEFIQEKTDRIISKIATQEDMNNFLNEKQKKRILICTNNSTLIEKFQEQVDNGDLFWSSGVEDVRMIEDSSFLKQIQTQQQDAELLKDHNCPFLAFLKNDKFQIERKVHFYEGSLDDSESMKEFIQAESLNLVEEISAENYLSIFGGPIMNQIHLFLDRNSDNSAVIEEFTKAARYNREEELWFERLTFVIHYFSEETQDFMEIFDVRGTQDLPFIGLSKLDYGQFGLTKFRLDKNTTQLNEAGILQFANEARTKTLRPHYRSEPEPNEKHRVVNGILKLVGSSFKETVMQDKLSYLVLFIDSKDPSTAKQYKEFLQEFRRVIPHDSYSSLLQLSSFDLNKNEVEYLNIDSAPKLVIYPRFYKQKPQAYKGPLKLESFTQFLNQWVRDLKVQVPLPIGGPSSIPDQATKKIEEL